MAVLLKQSRIGPAVDMDVLLLAIVHDHMKGECPRDAWVFPRRITDGRLPALNNVGGAALSSSSGMSATGAHILIALDNRLTPCRYLYLRVPSCALWSLEGC